MIGVLYVSKYSEAVSIASLMRSEGFMRTTYEQSANNEVDVVITAEQAKLNVKNSINYTISMIDGLIERASKQGQDHIITRIENPNKEEIIDSFSSRGFSITYSDSELEVRWGEK
jgi:hypothetical protein